ncbi:MAG: hypothetical protein H7336_10915 [Bacteriovorax sp.]|nr:hypothetical protein [Bacteriovorax sp.]
MKYVVIFILFTLASCSTTAPSSRGPAANSSNDVCLSSLKIFFNNEVTAVKKSDLLNKNIILQKDLKFLEGSIISKTFSDNSAERGQMEISYLLIKKQYPDFSEEQVIDHYQLLKVYCGM